MTYLSEEEFHDRVEKRHPDFAGSHPDFNYGAINEYVLYVDLLPE
jgi:carbonic anhydrase